MTDTSVHNHSVIINFYHHSLYIQAQYSLLCRSTEWELLEVCNREHIAMLPWSPLKGLAFELQYCEVDNAISTSTPTPNNCLKQPHNIQ